MKMATARAQIALVYIILSMFFSFHPVMAEENPAYDKSVFGYFPEAQAVEKMLLEGKKYDLPQQAEQVIVSSRRTILSALFTN